ncbi:MAG: hypothetical protein ACRET1_07410, partial [Burkholderiales bacterium]
MRCINTDPTIPRQPTKPVRIRIPVYRYQKRTILLQLASAAQKSGSLRQRHDHRVAHFGGAHLTCA